MPPVLSTFFSVRGRLSRRAWLLRLAMAAAVCITLGRLAVAWCGDGAAVGFSALFLWAATVLSAQRLHDIDKSGLQLLWGLVPVLGPLWVLVALMRRGVGASSRFAMPEPGADYLQVDISR